MASNDDKWQTNLMDKCKLIIWHDDKCDYMASNDDKCKLIIWHLMMINVN